MSKIERKWWFSGPVSGLAVYLSFVLLAAAGMPIARYGPYQWLVFFICFVGIKRTLSVLTWLILLCAAPALVKAKA
ncbi:MAG: hypothetical protein M3R60_13085 [Pseudomonadota bacterium]|nr:hypothetical protein [Pseudomonadota bacterium]